MHGEKEVEKAQISKETKDTYVVTAGSYQKRFLDYQEAIDNLPDLIRVYGYPASINKETVYLILETIE
ncbi:hypothetical protein [Kosakonia sacchari]|uniref:hypothetical protein n=1 Tax=Kosakonia sacchari TaxID=1158459 RepID=UPI001584F8CE|nr:hypothetical protein [Kosakonia sacchari]NUL36625.1 hypothetical protein [Kosakonia sacchari]